MLSHAGDWSRSRAMSLAVGNAAVKALAPFEVPYNNTACFSFCCCFLDLSCVLYADAAVVSDSFFRGACCARALRVCFVVSIVCAL